MPRRLAPRCFCCGVPAAQEALQCVTCEAAFAQFESCEPELYGEPIAVTIEVLIRVTREQVESAQEVVTAWRTGGSDALQASHFTAVAEITGITLEDATALQAANAAVATWLLEGGSVHVPRTFSLLYERYFVEENFDDPESLSYLGILESAGIKGHNRELAKYPSEANSQRHLQFVQRDLELLSSMEARQEDRKAPVAEQASVGILRWSLNNKVRGAQFDHHSYALDQMNGYHNDVVMSMTDLTPVRSLEDGWNYVQRLRAFPDRFGLIRDELILQRERGIIPPRFVLEKVLKQVQSLHDEHSQKPEESAMYTSLLERLVDADGGMLPEAPPDLKAAAREALSGEVAAAYASLVPPLQALLDVVSAEGYADHSGVQTLPQGAEFYAWRLAEQTSTDMSPEEVHALGHEQVTAIMSEMGRVIQRLAGQDATLDRNLGVAENMRRLSKDPRWLYPETQEGKDECLKDFRGQIDLILQVIDPFFDMRPKQPLKVQPVPKHMEEGSPGAFYMPPSLDGKRDGVFYANLGDMGAQYKFAMRTLTAHEGIPGHHFQIALAMEMPGLPHFRKVDSSFTAFVEGWALYTERLARELKFFATEPDGSEGYDLLGHFGDELMRATRLVVDTGLHYFGWSRQQAIEFMEEHSMLAPSDVITEVERYCVMPGQACSYKVGQLQILALREQLKEKLGETFDLRKFHRCLLSNGAIPVTMLAEVTQSLLE